MAVDDFDTSHNRECEYCHRKGFDEGDWLFMGWDDEHEMYICPDCQSTNVPTDDDLLVRDAQLRIGADAAGQETACAWDNVSSPNFDGCNGCEYACALGLFPKRP